MFDIGKIKKVFNQPPCQLCRYEKEQEEIRSAVLIPLVIRENGLTVLFTKRSEKLSHHPGQISFPGGHMEQSDISFCAAALREAREEINLESAQAEILCCMDPYVVKSFNYKIMPVVALIHPPFRFKAFAAEVEEIFEIPLDFLCDSKNWKLRRFMSSRGIEVDSNSLSYKTYCIWGITAGILGQFRKKLDAVCLE